MVGRVHCPWSKGQIKICTGKDYQCSFRRPGSLSRYTLALPRHELFSDVHGESMIEVGSLNWRCQDSTLPVGGARLVPPIVGLT
jgi:hypothetical protein